MSTREIFVERWKSDEGLRYKRALLENDLTNYKVLEELAGSFFKTDDDGLIDLRGIRIEGYNFSKLQFIYCNFQYAYLKNIDAIECHFNFSNFSHSSINGLFLKDGMSVNTIWNEANIECFKLENSSLNAAAFCSSNIKLLSADNCDMMLTDFTNSKISNIHLLNNCNLDGAKIPSEAQQLVEKTENHYTSALMGVAWQ